MSRSFTIRIESPRGKFIHAGLEVTSARPARATSDNDAGVGLCIKHCLNTLRFEINKMPDAEAKAIKDGWKKLRMMLYRLTDAMNPSKGKLCIRGNDKVFSWEITEV